MSSQDQQLFSDDPPRWTHDVSTVVMSTILNEEQRFGLLCSIYLGSHLDFHSTDTRILTSLNKLTSNCSARILRPQWKNRRTLFLFLLIPDSVCFHVRRDTACCIHGWDNLFYLVQVGSHLNGTFKLAVKKIWKANCFFFSPLNKYSTPAWSLCTVTKKETPWLPWKLWFQCHISLLKVSRSHINGWSCSKMADKGITVTSDVTSSSTPLTARSSLSCH